MGTLDDNIIRTSKHGLARESHRSGAGRWNIGKSGSSGERLRGISPIESSGVGSGGENGGAGESANEASSLDLHSPTKLPLSSNRGGALYNFQLPCFIKYNKKKQKKTNIP